ncbi:hypothetical protein ACPCH0_15695 [Bacillus bombysepticus]|nr:hypothetical protein [Bacillus cereus]MDR4986199.1 hypothetical protein [Bacillus cereus]
MQASTSFLLALSTKLQEIADDTCDVDTEMELNELIDKINESI